MNNELKIKPLMQYEVTSANGEHQTDTFTADTMVRDEGDLLFYRTGNLVRVYTRDAYVVNVVITPADEVPE